MYDTTPAAEAIVSRVFHLLSGAEAARMMASLEIDLDRGESVAIHRALLTLERTRSSERAAAPMAVKMQLAEIASLMMTPQPVRANSHIAAAASAASVIGSWFVTAHSEIAPMIFRTRVESPVL